MILNHSIAFLVCCVKQGLLWWENWVLMIPRNLGFLLMFLGLPFAIWLSLLLAVLSVSDFGLSLQEASVVSTSGRSVMSWGNLGMESCGTGSVLRYRQRPEISCPQLILGSRVLMALGGSLLGQEFEEKCWSYLCSQVCRHFWETISILVVFVCSSVA